MRFEDSDMVFSFRDEDCFRIERTQLYREVGTGVKICEAVVRIKNAVVFIEAKRSFPHPDKPGDVKKAATAAYEKFLNSILLYLGLQIGRPYKNPFIPANLMVSNFKAPPRIRCFYIIKNFNREWLQPATEAIQSKLSHVQKTLLIDSIVAINEDMARERGIIQ